MGERARASVAAGEKRTVYVIRSNRSVRSYVWPLYSCEVRFGYWRDDEGAEESFDSFYCVARNR